MYLLIFSLPSGNFYFSSTMPSNFSLFNTGSCSNKFHSLEIPSQLTIVGMLFSLTINMKQNLFIQQWNDVREEFKFDIWIINSWILCRNMDRIRLSFIYYTNFMFYCLFPSLTRWNVLNMTESTKLQVVLEWTASF